jgi:hypothetical protein
MENDMAISPHITFITDYMHASTVFVENVKEEIRDDLQESADFWRGFTEGVMVTSRITLVAKLRGLLTKEERTHAAECIHIWEQPVSDVAIERCIRCKDWRNARGQRGI